MKWPWCLPAALLAGLMLAALPGCGGSGGKVTITGKILKNGQPFQVSKDTQVKVIFTPESDQAGGTVQARFKYDAGIYEAYLTPGNYRVGCVLVDQKKGERLESASAAAKVIHDLTTSKELNIEVGGSQ